MSSHGHRKGLWAWVTGDESEKLRGWGKKGISRGRETFCIPEMWLVPQRPPRGRGLQALGRREITPKQKYYTARLDPAQPSSPHRSTPPCRRKLPSDSHGLRVVRKQKNARGGLWNTAVPQVQRGREQQKRPLNGVTRRPARGPGREAMGVSVDASGNRQLSRTNPPLPQMTSPSTYPKLQ